MFKKYFGRKSNPTKDEIDDELEEELLSINNPEPTGTSFKKKYIVGAGMLLIITFLGSFMYSLNEKNNIEVKKADKNLSVSSGDGRLKNLPTTYSEDKTDYKKNSKENDLNNDRNNNQQRYNQVPQGYSSQPSYNQIPQSQYSQQNNNVKSEADKQAEIKAQIEAAKAKEKLDANKSPVKFNIEGGSANEKKDS